MLLIIKDRLWEPTMFMKTKQIIAVTHDVIDNNGFE